MYTIETAAGSISCASDVLAAALRELLTPASRRETDLLAALCIDLSDDTFDGAALVG